jgi:citrate synthase
MKDGLERVVAAKTVISHADGESGKIWVRGRPIEELVARHGFEGSVALVWEGFVGEGFARADVVRRLGEGRRLAFAQLAHWLPAAKNRSLAEALRLALAVLPDDSEPPDIAATLPVAIAALLRIEQDQEPIAPDPALGKAEDFLRMLNGCAPAPRYVTALDHYLTTVIDNGLGSSAFAARVIISTKASLVSAILGAYLAFTGPLHGGAPSLALDMLDAIAASGDVDAWLDRRLSAGERLVGFGHRVFRRRDPRADILRAALEELAPSSPRLAFAREVERRALAALRRHKPDRTIEANVEMDAALLLEAIGVPRHAFTPVFAMARAPAWIAHALEQKRSGRMIRPTSVYTGELSRSNKA